MPAWSFSALTNFETCPKQYYEVKIAKRFKEQWNPQQGTGQDFHHVAEETLKHGTPMPSRFKHYAPVVDTVRTVIATKPGSTLSVENKMALDINHHPVPYFDKSVWVRAVTDFEVMAPGKRIAFAGDWKTGKEKPASTQLMLTAAVMFDVHPLLNKVTTAFVWLQTGNISREVIERSETPRIWDSFNNRLLHMQAAFDKGNFPPRPSGLCKNHCPVIDCPMNGHYVP